MLFNFGLGCNANAPMYNFQLGAIKVLVVLAPLDISLATGVVAFIVSQEGVTSIHTSNGAVY